MRPAVLALFLSACAGTLPVQEDLAQTPVQGGALYEWTATRASGEGWFRCSAVQLEPALLATAGHCTEQIWSEARLATAGSFVRVESSWTSPGSDAGLIRTSEPLPGTPARLSVDLPKEDDLGWISGYGCDPSRLRVDEAWFLGLTGPGVLVYEAHACPGDSGGGLYSATGALVALTVRANGLIVFGTPIAELLPGLVSQDEWVPVAGTHGP